MYVRSEAFHEDRSDICFMLTAFFQLSTVIVFFSEHKCKFAFIVASFRTFLISLVLTYLGLYYHSSFIKLCNRHKLDDFFAQTLPFSPSSRWRFMQYIDEWVKWHPRSSSVKQKVDSEIKSGGTRKSRPIPVSTCSRFIPATELHRFV